MLAFNLEKKDRVLLRQRIGSGALSASELSTMSSVDLANEQQKAQIDNAIKESLKDSILEARAAPKAKITHKGEEMIENVGGEDENTRVRSAEAEREYSREAQIARGRAQSDAAASAPLGTTSPGAAMADLPYADDALMSPILPTSTLPRSPIERRHSNASQGDSPKSPLMTKSPVFFDQPLPSATSPVSPSTAGFNLNSLAWSTNENEPADALSNSPRGDSDYFLSNNENGGGRNGDVLDTALDIDVDLDDEPDFDVFLDDVGVDGESSAKPTEEKKVEMVDEKLAKYLALPQVWQGNVCCSLNLLRFYCSRNVI